MSYLQIASWNIEHLGGAPRVQRKQSAFALADHIEMSGVDLIVLQEIYVTEDDDEVRIVPSGPVVPKACVESFSARRNSDLDLVCYLLEEHLEVPWMYCIIPNRSSSDTWQLCAVMWNAKRLQLQSMDAVPVSHNEGGLPLWDRKPHALTFTSDVEVWRKDEAGAWQKEPEKRRLSIVPLHMKSNYGGVTQNRIVRAHEAKTLCQGLKSMAYDPTLILIGDTNILNNSEPAITTFIENGFIDLNNNDASTYWNSQYPSAPFDRAFLAANRKEFRYTRQYVLRSSDLMAHDRFLSDHYMIKISIKDYVDDADLRLLPSV